MKKLSLLLLLSVSLITLKANNVVLANVLLNGQNTGSQYSLVNFDISWDNSWRTITNEANYDGAWLFMKFRKKSSFLWQHATLNAANTTTPAGSVVQTALDGKGAWIYKSLPGADFTGSVNYTGAKMRWDYGADGVLNTDSVEIRLFAVEMVYIPAGKYQLGSGGSESAHFNEATLTTPYNVLSEGAIIVGTTATNLTYQVSAGGGDASGPIPSAFPKGFQAFWIMKYECSQQQYVDFLNNLDLAKVVNRNPGSYTGTHPNLVAPIPERAAHTLSIYDNAAIGDWSAMRPFTELEYEKACRGFNQVPIANEYPWGNTTIAATSILVNPGTSSETASNGNANYGATVGTAIRCGIYATSTSNRQQSGATYYGVMEMAGNLYETTISVGNPTGRTFTGAHGDGNLDVNGDANVANWPVNGTGYGFRGGGNGDNAVQLRTSDRLNALYPGSSTTRLSASGSRLARTAE